MKRILLLIKHQQNRQLLATALEHVYCVLAPEAESDFETVGKQMLTEDFDLCMIDFAAIHLLRPQMLTRREAEIPTYLPFVFLTTRQDIGISADHLEQLIDDIVYLPVEKIELQTKIRVLLRSRFYSLQLRETQEKLHQSLAKEKELNKIKSNFVSKVSHDFRNPLNSISGMAQLLETYGNKLAPEKKAQILEQLKRNVIKMTELLDNVLLVSQKDMGKLQFNPAPLKLAKFCLGVINEVQTAFKNKQTINFTDRTEQQTFNLDSKLLDCILTNLLTNACKYSPKNKAIDCEIRSQDAELIFTIRDRGIGIPPKDIPYLFDSFYRASNADSHQGTGLGLAIVKEYVEFHQGSISVESQLEIGSTFVVRIPINNDDL